MADTKVVYGTSTAIRQNAFSRDGYTFGGWNAYRMSDNSWLYVNNSTGANKWIPVGSSTAGYTLKVYDAYRPIRVQRILFNIVKNKHWIANPDTTASNHNRGCAIDMSLIIDATGEEMEFPTPMHTFSEESARTCKTWSDAARANVDYITEVMAECGFNHIKSEWWHFSDTDSKKFMTTDIDLGSLTMLPKQEETNK